MTIFFLGQWRRYSVAPKKEICGLFCLNKINPSPFKLKVKLENFVLIGNNAKLKF